MGFYVRRHIPRTPEDADWAEQFREWGVATVSEAQQKTGLMAPYMRPIQTDRAIAGRAVTVLVPPGDNLMIHAALEVCQAGDVLVIAATTPSTNGVFGELLATGFSRQGVVGAVIDLGVRDTKPIRAMGFPVWAHHISAAGNAKQGPGWVNGPIVCGGMAVNPGDFVVADDDGVVVVGSQQLPTVAQAARVRVAKEEGTRRRYGNGELSLDFYQLRPLLAELGVEYLDR